MDIGTILHLTHRHSVSVGWTLGLSYTLPTDAPSVWDGHWDYLTPYPPTLRQCGMDIGTILHLTHRRSVSVGWTLGLSYTLPIDAPSVWDGHWGYLTPYPPTLR
ncbi:hypothetical protein RRG08_063448 [Elysia crispata]|uniref:Uncharacterized protein n=1 Tax=Elysia crispata TaxID=231223 RepID=A0AAE1AA39_9GAST|nr:hypothetical protein RRG08_063448 [Elysia crispata]